MLGGVPITKESTRCNITRKEPIVKEKVKKKKVKKEKEKEKREKTTTTNPIETGYA